MYVNGEVSLTFSFSNCPYSDEQFDKWSQES